MDKGWLELESDPGLFTLLLEDFGVRGVQVEEVYDLQKPFEGEVYGFIFLFRWIEERRSRRKMTQEEESFVMDENVVNNMFFAQQVISNSCATHALLSVLLNTETVSLGDTLSHLKRFTRDMNPEDKGFAIGNIPELSKAHNSHARPEVPQREEKQKGIATVRTMEAFHFVSYVPVNGHLFELDGLKPYPIDHGPLDETEPWTDKFRRVITERLGIATGGEPYHDIRFNLMAVVPDRQMQYEHKLKTLKTNRQIVLEALQQLLDSKMVKVTNPDLSPNSAKSLLSNKSEPIMTRSVAAAAREALANHQAEKDALTVTDVDEDVIDHSSEGKVSRSSRRSTPPKSGTPPTSGEILKCGVTVVAQPDFPARNSGSPMPPGLDCHSYAKSPVLCGQGVDIEEGVAHFEAAEGESGMAGPKISSTPLKPESVLSTATGHKLPISQLMVDGNELTPIKSNSIKIEVSVSDESQEGTGNSSVTMATTVATTDVTKPLTIQTKFAAGTSPGPSSESTDTASEVASLLNSPAGSSNTTVSAHSSPNTSSLLQKLSNKSDLETLPIDKVAIGHEALFKVKADLEAGNPSLNSGSGAGLGATNSSGGLAMSDTKKEGQGADGSIQLDSDEKLSPRTARSKFSSSQGFTPKDLLALLKNVEHEISMTEQNLKDEAEKKKKYKIDDRRRTHNYDQFIFTFLSMLAEQGHLAGLVQQHMSTRKRVGIAGAGLKKRKTPEKNTKNKTKKKR